VRAGDVVEFELVGRTEHYIHMHDIDNRDQKGAGPKLGLRAMLPSSVSIFYCTVQQTGTGTVRIQMYFEIFSI
jgi:hypothetical protein